VPIKSIPDALPWDFVAIRKLVTPLQNHCKHSMSKSGCYKYKLHHQESTTFADQELSALHSMPFLDRVSRGFWSSLYVVVPVEMKL
jgi:hypothetical protein